MKRQVTLDGKKVLAKFGTQIVTTNMQKTIFKFYHFVFARAYLYRFNLHLYKLVLRSLGVLNSDTAEATGEPWFLKQLQRRNVRVIVDVGANDLAYGQAEFPQAKIFAFEPHPDSYLRLVRGAARNVVPVNAAVGESAGVVDFWDFDDGAPRKKDQPTSQLATVHKGLIEQLYQQPAKQYQVNMMTLDSFCEQKNIAKIDLLKIDAEGNELAVLKGASNLLAARGIDCIQFEFNETTIFAGVFFKDFVDMLPDFTFYRLLPAGAVSLGEYRPLTHEIFGFQNIVAVRKTLRFQI